MYLTNEYFYEIIYSEALKNKHEYIVTKCHLIKKI